MPQTNERIRQILGAQATYEQKFLFAALMELLGEEATDRIIDSFLPVPPATQQIMFGRPLGFYAGLSRTRMKQADIGLDDAQVDAIFAALGVTSGTSAPAGLQEGMFQPSSIVAMKGEGSEDGSNDGVAEGYVADTANTGGGVDEDGIVQFDADGTLHAEVKTVEESNEANDSENPTTDENAQQPADGVENVNPGGGVSEEAVDSQPQSQSSNSKRGGNKNKSGK